MNRSFRRVDKLVDATNSTWSQIKSSSTFDDRDGKLERKSKKATDLRSSCVYSSYPQELEYLDGDFKSQANKMLSDMEKLLNSNKISHPRENGSRVSRVRHKMKEINEKIENLRSEKLTAKETEKSRQKLFRLVNEDFHGSAAAEKRQKDSDTNNQISFVECERRSEKEEPMFKKLEPEKASQSRHKSKEELKSKILETQDIVDRGFHTARELTQKVKNMSKGETKREKTPGSESTVIISELTDLKSLNRSRRSRSSEGSYGLVRSRRRSRRYTDKEKKNKGQEKKNALVNMKRADWPEEAGPHLKFQRLPSLHIKGELQLQKIHNLEILPEKSERVFLKANTAINIFSHEKLEKEKKKKMLEEFEKENRFFPDEEISGAAIECSNCGKLIKMPKKSVDSREIDKVLLDCNFNVFDPRIEEFVEKWSEGVARGYFRVEKRDHVTGENREQFSENKEIKKTPSSSLVINKRRADFEGKRLKIEELIEELSQRYKERVNILEDDHLRLESILRNLYDKVSQSKKFFHVCKLSSLSKNQKSDCRKVENLSATTPLVICLAGDADVSELSISKPSHDPDAFAVKHTGKLTCPKADRKEEARKKRSMECGNYGCGKSPEVNEKNKGTERESEGKKESDSLKFLPVTGFGKHNMDIGETNVESKRSLSPDGSRKEAEPTFGLIRVSISEKTENDYESDFEKESLAGEKIGESQEENHTGFNNLLTVSRANSEFEKTINQVNKRGKCAVSKNYPAMLESKKELIDEVEMSKKEEICSGINEDASEDFDVKVDYTLQDRRKALKTPRAFQESVQNLFSPPSANANFSNESGDLKAESRKHESENSVSIKNDLLPESKRAERRKSRSRAFLSRKSSSTEEVASLQEILTAMEDQFVKTELLVDKLTENVKDLSGRKGRKITSAEPVFTRKNAIFPCNLSLKNFLNKNEDLDVGDPCSLVSEKADFSLLAKAGSAKQEKVNNRKSFGESSFSAVSVGEEEVSSAGEVNVNNLSSDNSVCYRKLASCEKSRQNSDSENCFKIKINGRESCQGSAIGKNHAREKNNVSSITLGSEPEETYSDGEIKSEGLLEAKSLSIHSVGELISEIVSASSIRE